MKSDLFKKAYKKLKSSIYYDRTLLILRDEIVKFESNAEINHTLKKFDTEISDPLKREVLKQEILDSISFSCFPKKISVKKSEQYKADMLISNSYSSEIVIQDNDLQYFIDMEIRGHILGVLWLILIGYQLDKGLYEHSYGNRIRKNLYNEFSAQVTFSPYLFEPYFQQYENWRDNGMNLSSRFLNEGKNIAIITMDFERFYYSLDLSKTFFDKIKEEIQRTHLGSPEELDFKIFLNDFIKNVVEKYSKILNNTPNIKSELNGRKILPIGFLPSNVLSNFALKNFDNAIIDRWNPLYYGRYVDDILIVDKIEDNSTLLSKAEKGELNFEEIINFYFSEFSTTNPLFLKENQNEPLRYTLNKLYNPISGEEGSNIRIKNDKVRMFYFNSSKSDALITCFRDTIAKNRSEFRHMPEDEHIFQRDDYSKIYNLKNEESINKFRELKGISIDKFELSKLLGKYLRIGGLIDDNYESKFEKEIIKIFDSKTILENYTVWEKILEILVIHESYDTLLKFVRNIFESIEMLNEEKNKETRISLLKFLSSSLSRTFSLVWGKTSHSAIKNIIEIFKNHEGERFFQIEECRKLYLNTKMSDKSVVPIFYDMLDTTQIMKASDELFSVNLTKFNQIINFLKIEWKNGYCYYPYIVTMYDFSIIYCMEEIQKNDYYFGNLETISNKQISSYMTVNYNKCGNINNNVILSENLNLPTQKKTFLVSVNNEKKTKITIAIANVVLNYNSFQNLKKDKADRTYLRYKDLSKLINQSIDEKVDMLIMPESFIPFEWLATIARTCAKNKIAVITGVEHIKIHKNVFNLTAVILPYADNNENNTAYISFHLKTNYAPAEKDEIIDYGFNAIEGNTYELYKWSDCYFPVYCCYELSSIADRAIFQSYADFLVAVEWNKDTNYYSNIIESLSRDLHCYCVQVNSSEYGDSRIMKPSRSIEKNILQTKGGINSTILTAEIDITKLRNFQIKGYRSQQEESSFKPTPPGFNQNIVLQKIHGNLKTKKEKSTYESE